MSNDRTGDDNLRRLHGDPDRPYPGKNARKRFGADKRERDARYQTATRRHELGFAERTRLWDYLKQHGINCVRLDAQDQFAPWPFRTGDIYIASKARGEHVINARGFPKYTSFFVPAKKVEIARMSPHRHYLIWHSDDLLECVWTNTIREDWRSYGYQQVDDRIRDWQKKSPTYRVWDKLLNVGWQTFFASLRGEWERPAGPPKLPRVERPRLF